MLGCGQDQHRVTLSVTVMCAACCMPSLLLFPLGFRTPESCAYSYRFANHLISLCNQPLLRFLTAGSLLPETVFWGTPSPAPHSRVAWVGVLESTPMRACAKPAGTSVRATCALGGIDWCRICHPTAYSTTCFVECRIVVGARTTFRQKFDLMHGGVGAGALAISVAGTACAPRPSTSR